ncbi:hypothetical protein C8F01DRAFT_1276931 [Mycena amicta]|nr:hypothetical protein C8F01DRAFT_1276931 [Mycena amicta]
MVRRHLSVPSALISFQPRVVLSTPTTTMCPTPTSGTGKTGVRWGGGYVRERRSRPASVLRLPPKSRRHQHDRHTSARRYRLRATTTSEDWAERTRNESIPWSRFSLPHFSARPTTSTLPSTLPEDSRCPLGNQSLEKNSAHTRFVPHHLVPLIYCPQTHPQALSLASVPPPARCKRPPTSLGRLTGQDREQCEYDTRGNVTVRYTQAFTEGSPSNSAADLIATRLMNLGRDTLFHCYAPSRNKEQVDLKLRDFTYTTVDGRFSVPPLARMKRFCATVTTLVSASVVSGIGIP